ncbi:anaphase-promoting complex subunit 15B-like isoform X2 [Colias croceus]|uniref:anaphase-promoting complex subunit 15B-like isoform X1 n=1 Tax=Colias crocea TaxID=72248 RepID=UPI001E280A60|nr:anaphase-promoting complex subunit 15B-like isoform X1 [Colias croceus]XP_045509510.1 anaphase-promoting complex subunit 15B-like isoform X2 [Colias croceus]
MDIPFPAIRPLLTFADWFNADNPCDEDAELTKLEQAHRRWLNSFTKRCVKHAPVEKSDPEPIDDAETDDGGNEDADESEDSHDVDEEERIPATDSPEHNEQEQNNLDDDFIPDVEVVEASLWPYTISDP